MRRYAGGLWWMTGWLASLAILLGLGSIVLLFIAPRAIGWEAVTVRSGSMEPAVQVGSLLLVADTAPQQVEVGDIIAVLNPADPKTRIIHRVVEIVEQDGALSFRTQGDANNTPDKQLVPADAEIGRMEFQIAKLGHLAEFLRTTQGFLLVIGVPALFIILGETVKIVRMVRTWRERPSDEVA